MPRLGVHGNHDPPGLLHEVEVEDLHLRRASVGGLTIAGFEGCVRYGHGGPHQYTQKEATKLVKKLPAADVLICHCPPTGINDDPEDPAHLGIEALRDWVDRHQPRYVLHGHVHPLGGRVMTRLRRHAGPLGVRRAGAQPELTRRAAFRSAQTTNHLFVGPGA